MAAKGLDTHRTRLYDDLGALPWPEGIDGRTLRNAFSEQPEALLQQVPPDFLVGPWPSACSMPASCDTCYPAGMVRETLCGGPLQL